MTKLVCDTSGLLALVDSSDAAHGDVLAVVEQHAGPFVVSPLVLAELDFLIRARLGPSAARGFLQDVADGAYDVASLTSDTVRRCLALDKQYADLNIGLTDAHVIVMTWDETDHEVLTLDHRRFRAVTDPSGASMRLLPADG